MNNLRSKGAILGVTLFCLCVITLAHAAEFRSGDQLTIQGAFSDVIFASGEDITGDFESTDDVFLAGGQVRLNGRTSENAFVAGGNLSIRTMGARLGALAGGLVSVSSSEFSDLILFGGTAELSQIQVQDETIIFAGRIRVNPRSRMGGNLIVAGNHVFFAGQADRDAWISGSTVILDGEFNRNLKVIADHLEVRPGTVIKGEFNYSATSASIMDGATIEGETIVGAPPVKGMRIGPLVVFWTLLSIIGVFLVPVALIFLFRGIILKGAVQVRNGFWEVLGKGVLTFIIIPVSLLIAFFSGIGFAVGLTALPFILVGMIIGWGVTIFLIGDQVRRWYLKVRKQESSEPEGMKQRAVILWTLLGAFLYFFISSIPIIGGLITFIILSASVGSIVVMSVEKLKSGQGT